MSTNQQRGAMSCECHGMKDCPAAGPPYTNKGSAESAKAQVASGSGAEESRPVPHSDGSVRGPKNRCTGTTKGGNRCWQPAQLGHERCYYHGGPKREPVVERLRAEVARLQTLLRMESEIELLQRAIAQAPHEPECAIWADDPDRCSCYVGRLENAYDAIEERCSNE